MTVADEINETLKQYLHSKGVKSGKHLIPYHWRKLGWIEPNGTWRPMCLLCETKDNITCRAYWLSEEKEGLMLTMYFLCDVCYEELEAQTEKERESMVAKVIEPKIEMWLKTGTWT